MSIIVLYVLAVLDFVCCGYRAASGRVALLDKRDFFRRSIMSAVAWGHVVLVGILLVIGAGLAVSADKQLLLMELDRAVYSMLLVYVPYTLLFAVALLLRQIPSVDVRAITSTVILGPMTFIRPFVAVLGVVMGIIACPYPEIVFLGAFAISVMLMLEVCLDWQSNYVADSQ